MHLDAFCFNMIYTASHSYPLCYTQLIVVMMFRVVMFCQVSVSGRLSMVVDC